MSTRPQVPDAAMRAAAAVLLLLWSLFHVAAFLDQRDWMDDARPRDLTGWNWFWVGNFHMFTGQSTKHSKPIFEGWFPEADADGPAGWRPLPMATWYPARWESGYRWERPPVYKYDSARVPFLIAACEKSGAKVTRLVLEKWPMVLGTSDQSPDPDKVTRKLIRTWDCALKAPHYAGRRL